MKDRILMALLTAIVISTAVTVYAQQAPQQLRIIETNDDEFFGGASQGPRQEMMFERFDGRLYGRMMGGYGVMGGYFNPEMADIAEAYKVKIEKVFLEAKESRLDLDKKRREQFFKLRELADRYKTDKTVSKDIVGLIKDMNVIQKQIMDINTKAMEKIQDLNRDREKEFRTANDSWIRKLETDEKELGKYLEFLDSASTVIRFNFGNPPPKK